MEWWIVDLAWGIVCALAFAGLVVFWAIEIVCYRLQRDRDVLGSKGRQTQKKKKNKEDREVSSVPGEPRSDESLWTPNAAPPPSPPPPPPVSETYQVPRLGSFLPVLSTAGYPTDSDSDEWWDDEDEDQQQQQQQGDGGNEYHTIPGVKTPI